MRTSVQGCLVEVLDVKAMLGRTGRFERLGSSMYGLMVWRDLDLGVSCGALSRPGDGVAVTGGKMAGPDPAPFLRNHVR